MKILAVDDDIFILELLSIVASRAGYKDVSTAVSGEIALEMLRSADVRYDCLLFDISMPGMDGLELCALARAIPQYAKTPIIMLTAMTEKHYVDRAFAAGASDYANKPFDIVELSARLRVAKEMEASRRLADTAMKLHYDQQKKHVETQSLPLSFEVQIEGITSLVEHASLRNYLAQLSLTGAACSQVLAIKVDQISCIHMRASQEEFLYSLAEVASAISRALQSHTHLMAHVGNGTFVVVCGNPAFDSAENLEAEIQFLLDERDLQFDNGDPLDMNVSVGNPIRPNTSNIYCVRNTFERAIARAESRAFYKPSERSVLNIRSIIR